MTQRCFQRGDQSVPRLVQDARRRFDQCRKQPCEAARLHSGRAVEVTRGVRQLRDQVFNRCLGLGRRRFGIDPVGVEGILQKKACVLDERELGILIFGNEDFAMSGPARPPAAGASFRRWARLGQDCL